MMMTEKFATPVLHWMLAKVQQHGWILMEIWLNVHTSPHRQSAHRPKHISCVILIIDVLFSFIPLPDEIFATDVGKDGANIRLSAL